jgi:hypothetical protein
MPLLSNVTFSQFGIFNQSKIELAARVLSAVSFSTEPLIVKQLWPENKATDECMETLAIGEASQLQGTGAQLNKNLPANVYYLTAVMIKHLVRDPNGTNRDPLVEKTSTFYKVSSPSSEPMKDNSIYTDLLQASNSDRAFNACHSEGSFRHLRDALQYVLNQRVNESVAAVFEASL